MEMNLGADLLPYAHAEISGDGINVCRLRFGAIAVPGIERLLEQLVVRCGVGYVPESDDRSIAASGGVGRGIETRDSLHPRQSQVRRLPWLMAAGSRGGGQQDCDGENRHDCDWK